MTVEKFTTVQCHEFDVHWHFVDDGLTPYYGFDQLRKSHDWKADGKPTAEIVHGGEEWALCFDYDSQPLLPWEDPSYELESTPLFRIYVVAKDGLYDDERADASKRVRGGTITVRPRWPNMKTVDDDTGEVDDVDGYMDLGVPYLDVQFQGSNIEFERYLELAQDAVAAFGIPRRYFDRPHDTSNINDAAVYVRPQRDDSGPLHAADGPIARAHNLLQSDREGIRVHREDNRKLPGYHVSALIDEDRARKLIRGHSLGKELKHYYPKHPTAFNPDEYGYHPKFEVSYQSAHTSETVYWDELADMRRELEEALLNALDWAGLSVRGGDHFFKDAYFDPHAEERRSRKLVEDPLPEVEDEQEAHVINLWREMRDSDQALVETVLSDGGKVAPKDAAEETGYSYRTIREAIDRCEGFIEHHYGELEIASKYQQQEMLRRLHAAEENFRETIGQTVREVAEATDEKTRGVFDKWRQRYNATVRRDRDDCRMLVEVGYTATDREDLRAMLREATTAIRQQHGFTSGVHVVVELADGTRERVRNIRDAFNVSPSQEYKAYDPENPTPDKPDNSDDESDPSGMLFDSSPGG